MSDLSECLSVSTAKSNSSSSRKVGRKAVRRDSVITDMVDIICSSEYLRTNVSSETLSVRETCVSRRRPGTRRQQESYYGSCQQLLSTTFEPAVALQSR